MATDNNQWNPELTESTAIPFKELTALLSVLEYGSTERVIIEMLALTGCRCKSIDNMRIDKIHEGVLYWHEGKSTRGLRRERLPEWYWKEIEHYRERSNVRGIQLFGILWHSWRKQWDLFVRPVLPLSWQERRLVPYGTGWREEYVLQLKGLRKMYQTAEFLRQLDRWKDAGMALQMTSKRMRHNSERITAYHYVREFSRITPQDALKGVERAIHDVGRQQRLLEYF